MIVIADASPLIVLVNIGHVDVLATLFGQVIIPAEVAAELTASTRPPAVRQFMDVPPPWLTTKSVGTRLDLSGLHPGELAAISLAKEMNADLLLIDEAAGRKAAVELHIPIAGTIGVLESAADRKLLDLETAFEQIKQTDFWISGELLDQRLAEFRERQKRVP